MPSILREDNTGCIFLVNNDSVGNRTKHVDIRMRFVNEMVRDKTLWVAFIRGDDNPGDIETKNTRDPIYLKHSARIYEGTLDLDSSTREDVNMMTICDDGVTRDLADVTHESTSPVIVAVADATSMEQDIDADRVDLYTTNHGTLDSNIKVNGATVDIVNVGYSRLQEVTGKSTDGWTYVRSRKSRRQGG
jgi:hypothetical protein